jgi:hypothetical protein
MERSFYSAPTCSCLHLPFTLSKLNFTCVQPARPHAALIITPSHARSPSPSAAHLTDHDVLFIPLPRLQLFSHAVTWRAPLIYIALQPRAPPAAPLQAPRTQQLSLAFRNSAPARSTLASLSVRASTSTYTHICIQHVSRQVVEE